MRSLVVEARGQGVAAGAEDVTVHEADGRSTLTSYDPATGRTRTTRGAAEIPSLVFATRTLLRDAQAEPASAVRLGEPPLELRRHSEGTTRAGRPCTYSLRERVLARDVLPDTPASRRQLRLGGPTG